MKHLDLFIRAKEKAPRVQKFFADQGYVSKLQNRCLLKIGYDHQKSGRYYRSQVIPKRWIVERTFAWLSNFSRTSKDYEHSSLTLKTNIFFNMITKLAT